MKYFKYLLLLLFCFVTSVSADTTYKQGVLLMFMLENVLVVIVIEF